MPEEQSIPKVRPKLESEDYAFLRKKGIDHIKKLAGQIWTDYNIHDPGITILELLCYAITDLAYRTSYGIEDILATRFGSAGSDEKSFYTAAEIFPNNPVSITDFRKLIVDLPGVKNVWLEEYEPNKKLFYANYENSTLTFKKPKAEDKNVTLKGFYNILLEPEEANDTETVNEVKTKIHKHRNLCEDFYEIKMVTYEDIAVCADIEVSRDAEIETVQAEIFYELAQYFSPEIQFYTIDELLKKGKSVDEIFEGPLLEHGFIDSAELERSDLRKELRVSDIINSIMDIEGVVAVKNMLLTSYISEERKQENKNWILQLSDDNSVARLDINKSKIIFFKDILPYIANKDEVSKKYKELNESKKKYKLAGHERDFEIPKGTFKDIEDYAPVQHDFPLCYGIGEIGLPESATPLRKAQARQLKAYLLFFEQLLANYLSQLAHVKELFSFDDKVGKSYFTQQLSNIKDIEDLYFEYGNFENVHQDIVENTTLFEKRRNRFLNHLMGRFSEEFTEYSLLLYSLMEKAADQKLIKDKIAFLSDYVELSSNRGKAFNYMSGDVWNTDNVAGMKKRICRLLGFEGYRRRTLACEHITIEKSEDKWVIKVYDPDDSSNVFLTGLEDPHKECAESMLQYILAYGDNEDHYEMIEKDGKFSFTFKNDCNEDIASSKEYNKEEERDRDYFKVKKYFRENCDIEGFHLIEHILLRPRENYNDENYKFLPICVSRRDNACEHEKDPYSFRISVVLPSWPEKFRNLNFRRFIEKTIRTETPAHIFPRVCWIDNEQMNGLEKAYEKWLKDIQTDKPVPEVVSELITQLINLKNIFPVARLHDCEYSGDEPQVILDYTSLGII